MIRRILLLALTVSLVGGAGLSGPADGESGDACVAVNAKRR